MFTSGRNYTLVCIFMNIKTVIIVFQLYAHYNVVDLFFMDEMLLNIIFQQSSVIKRKSIVIVRSFICPIQRNNM